MSKKEQRIFLSNESGEGLGKFTFPDGDTYEGEFKDGERTGQGTFYYTDGSVYVGEFKDGKEHGQGTYIWSNGNKYVGEWKDGKEWNGTIYDKYGKMTKSKFVNGEYTKQ